MTERKNSERCWYRFIDGNKKYDYKSLFNAVLWAERKAPTSTSREIKIYRVSKRKGKMIELEQVARVIANGPSPSRKVIGINDEIVNLPPTRGGTTTSWRDIDIYNEYKEKENWVSSQEIQKN